MNNIFVIHDLVKFPDFEYGTQQVVLASSKKEAYDLAVAYVTRYSAIPRDIVPLEKAIIEEWSIKELVEEDSIVLASFVT